MQEITEGHTCAHFTLYRELAIAISVQKSIRMEFNKQLNVVNVARTHLCLDQ